MPKRIGYIFDKVKQRENVEAAFHKIIRGEKWQSSELLREVTKQSDAIIDAITILIEDENYAELFHEPHCFSIKEGISKKKRDIAAPLQVPDQIAHWALVQVMEPIFMKGMYRYCCGSIPNRGPGDVRKYLSKKLNESHAKSKYKYCLKMDIHHFFQSVDKEILIKLLEHKVKDKQIIHMIQAILDTVQEGLPIGYYTSQWLANFYLESLDHFIKEDLQAEVYVRYVDDLVILGSNKRNLHQMRERIQEFLFCALKLSLKGNYQVFKIKRRGIDFCGFRFYHGHTGIRKGILKNIVKANRRCFGKTSKHALLSMISYYGYLDHTDTYLFARKMKIPSKHYFIKRVHRLEKANADHERELNHV